jgi:peptidoglycan/LPS O-acetylase OafA/YrhL
MKVAFKPVFTAHGGIALLAYAGSALAVAALLYLGVERPFLRWRNRLLQTKTAQGEWAVSATA